MRGPAAQDLEAADAGGELSAGERPDLWMAAGIGGIARPGEVYTGGAFAFTVASETLQARLRGGFYQDLSFCFSSSCGPAAHAGEFGILAGLRETDGRSLSVSINAGPGLLVLDDGARPALLLEADVMVGWRIAGLGLVGLADLSAVGVLRGAMLTLNFGKVF